MGWIDQRGSEVLLRNECFRLLALHAGGIGRVGICEAGRMTIEPVLYRVLDHDVVIQVGAGSMLESAQRQSIVSFEVDNLCPPEAWSVHVRGLARLCDPTAASRARPKGVVPLVPEPGTALVLIRSDTVTGRRYELRPAVRLSDARGLLLADLDLQPPIRMPRTATVRDVAAAMDDHHATCVLLGDGPAPLVIDRDVVGALAGGLLPDEPAADIATWTPLWATTTTSLADAAAKMAMQQAEDVLVIAPDGTPVGVLTYPEALHHLRSAAGAPAPATL